MPDQPGNQGLSMMKPTGSGSNAAPWTTASRRSHCSFVMQMLPGQADVFPRDQSRAVGPSAALRV